MSQPSALIAVLQKVPLFVDLSPTQLKRVIAICQQEIHEPGTALCRLGGESDRMFILLSGTVEIQGVSGAALIEESAITTIGEAGMLTGEPRSATVVATTDISAMAIKRRQFMRLVQDDPSLAVRLYRNVMVANQRIDALLQLSSTDSDDGEED